jgi:hypothetical protein
LCAAAAWIEACCRWSCFSPWPVEAGAQSGLSWCRRRHSGSPSWGSSAWRSCRLPV